eukprot:scaffold59883_cov66-Cyclotella_meneghiniana.AAC.5
MQKGMIGPAILYLPHAFAHAGYAVAIPLLVLSTMMFLWSSQCLLESWRIENDKLSRHSSASKRKQIHLSYPELAYRAFGPRGERMVQIGFAFDALVNYDEVTNNNDVDRSDDSFVEKVSQRLGEMTPFNPSGWFLFIGTSVFMFEGSITLLLPQQEAVRSPSDRKKFPILYPKVITSIVCFYCFYSIFCWMAFGDDVRTVMTTSLPPGTMATTIQLAYSFAVIFTFPLQNYPSLEIVRRSVDRFQGEKAVQSQQQDSIISAMIVVLLSIIAVTTMNVLDKVVGIMGSVLGIPLAFIFPPLIHNKLAAGSMKGFQKIGNLICAGLGILAVIISMTATIT